MPRLTVALAPVPGPLFALGSVEETVAAAAELGFDAIDVAVGRPDPVRRTELGKIAADSGLRVSALLTGPARTEDGLSLSDPATAEPARARATKLAETAAELGADLVIGWMVGVLPETEERRTFERTLETSLARVAATAASMGVGVLLEPINRYESNVAPTAAEALRLVERAGGDIELILDSFHANIEEADPIAVARDHADRTGLVQVSDSNRRMPGDGHFPLRAWIDAIREGGYRGDFALEANYGPDPVQDAGRAISKLRELGI